MDNTQKNLQEQQEKDTNLIEIHSPKMDNPTEINKKKQEQTERKFQDNSPSEEKSK